jgi:hypothetical protein
MQRRFSKPPAASVPPWAEVDDLRYAIFGGNVGGLLIYLIIGAFAAALLDFKTAESLIGRDRWPTDRLPTHPPSVRWY